MPDTTELTEKESAALLKTVQLWEAILQLKNEHPDFIQEARFHIHALQNMIAARPILRKLTA